MEQRERKLLKIMRKNSICRTIYKNILPSFQVDKSNK